jgi:DNA end-binding protein Ku
VRSQKDLHIERVAVSDAELQLALKIIEQGEAQTYDPAQYEDEEKKRVLAAIDAKIAGKQIVMPQEVSDLEGGQVIDLMEALRASLSKNAKTKQPSGRARPTTDVAELPAKPRKVVKRVEKPVEATPAPTKVRARR